MDFKYSLDHSARKFICPACNKKRFVRYLDITTNEYHPDTNLGRCDRSGNCNTHRIPAMGTPAKRVEFLICQTISQKAYKITERNNRVHIIPKSVVMEMGKGYAYIADWFLAGGTMPKTGLVKHFGGGNMIILTPERVAEPKEPSFHPLEMLEKSASNNLTKWLLTKFPRYELEDAVSKYNLTGINNPWESSTVFWLVGLENEVRGGKVLHYGTDGKRTKDPYPRISWIHSILKAEDFNLVQCLYGLNLTKERPESEIAIVESEKTAIYMSIKESSKIWVSCGSSSGLKPALLEAIKTRKITAYPDRGCFNDWLSKAEVLNKEGYSITVNNSLEAEDLPDGSDLIDYYERLTKQKNETT